MGPIDVARHGAAVEGRFLWISIFMYPGYPTNPQPCFSTNLYMAYLAYCTCILRSSLFQRFWECMFSLPGVLSCFSAGWIQRLALKLTMWSSESQNSGWQQIGHVRGREVFIRQLFINEITQPHFICRLAFFFLNNSGMHISHFFFCAAKHVVQNVQNRDLVVAFPGLYHQLWKSRKPGGWSGEPL